MNSLFTNIDFNVVENVVYADREVDVVFDNNIKVWERKSLSDVILTLKDGTQEVWKFDDNIIPDSAFKGRTDIDTVYIADNITSVGTSAFTDCSGITSIRLSNNITEIKEICRRCKSLVSIEMPSYATSFANNAFAGCSSLIAITIPEGITALGTSTFYGCSNLVDISLPSTLKIIGDYCFFQNRGLISVEIPEGVTTLSASSFEQCTSLESISIPSTVKSFGNYALAKNTSLAHIYYSDTTSKWASISKSSRWKDGTPTTCIVHCTDGDINI